VLVLAFSTSSPLCALCLLAVPITATATFAADGPAFEIRVVLVENGLCDSSIPLFVVLDSLDDVF